MENICFSFQMTVEMFDYMDDILNLQQAGKITINYMFLCLVKFICIMISLNCFQFLALLICHVLTP